MNLWPTPVGRYDLSVEFRDFEATQASLIEDFPQRTWDNNRFPFPDTSAYTELQHLMKRKLREYSEETGLGQDLVYFDGFFNTHGFGQVNAPHAHPLCIVVAVYYVSAHPGQGDILLQDPRGGVNWENVTDEDSRGIGGYRIFKRITPKTGEMLVFPAYLIHSVEPNLFEKPRMSLAVNCFSKQFLKYAKEIQ